MSSQETIVHSPAKVNLMLSVHGRRPDGFHELTSLMCALRFGDTLTIRLRHSNEDRLNCSNPAIPSGSENLVLRAASAFRERSKQAVYFEFNLEKRIPAGAGFGGGSGNAVAALSGMNQLLNNPLDAQALHALAAELGSDCPFFIKATPAWIYGRGERIVPLAADLCEKLRGTPIVLFKPHFGVSTGWAYECLADGAGKYYRPGPVDTQRMEAFIRDGNLSTLLCNTFEIPVGKKYLAIPTLLEQLRSSGAVCMMSGSGSGCFALPKCGKLSFEQLEQTIKDAWGEEVFWVETSIE